MKSFGKPERSYNEFRVVMRMFQVIVGLGLFLSLATLAAETPQELSRHLLYISWFAVTFASVEAILHWLKAGVIVLIVATLTVTIVEFASGQANLGGASLGLLVAFILMAYIWPVWPRFE
ncbi:MAG: hypothetical protein OHK0046_10420 [Anaerolineae bacterium]